jgi:hypothetical protein
LTIELIDEGVSVLLVRMHDRFGVGAGAENMSDALQVGAQLELIEYLAVEDGPDGLVFVTDRLIASGQIDDGEARVRQAHGAALMEAEAIGPAVTQRADHALQLRPAGCGAAWQRQ